MKNYDIEMHYGADVLNIYEYDELEDTENILERIEDGEFDIQEDSCFIESVNELYVNGEAVEGWQEEFEELSIPETGLCATGGWCRGVATFTLELPNEEELDVSKLIAKGISSIYYRLKDDTIIEAEFEDDDEDDAETGDVFYYNGIEIEE